jgi:hypothetical protein
MADNSEPAGKTGVLLLGTTGVGVGAVFIVAVISESSTGESDKSVCASVASVLSGEDSFGAGTGVAFGVALGFDSCGWEEGPECCSNTSWKLEVSSLDGGVGLELLDEINDKTELVDDVPEDAFI